MTGLRVPVVLSRDVQLPRLHQRLPGAVGRVGVLDAHCGAQEHGVHLVVVRAVAETVFCTGAFIAPYVRGLAREHSMHTAVGV